VNENSFVRVAHFRSFKLPGGEAAIKQPRRTALGVLYEIFGDGLFEKDDLIPVQNFSKSELPLLQQMLARGLNAPVTTSAGRLFDAVAAIAGLRQHASFEGQAAMELEFAIGEERTEEAYPFGIADFGLRGNLSESTAASAAIRNPQSAIIIDWQPMILEIVQDIQHGQAVGMISAKFHNTLAEMIVALARTIGGQKVVLTGGCFQNKYLTERAVHRLMVEGFKPYWHQRVPPNDGGIALGQVLVAREKVKSP
jgi:hydrogenase maturation protein HypF